LPHIIQQSVEDCHNLLRIASEVRGREGAPYVVGTADTSKRRRAPPTRDERAVRKDELRADARSGYAP
jgi:hypothetical protein